MAVPSFSGKTGRRDGELSVRDPAVVRGQQLRDQNAQPGVAEQLGAFA
jgi:hypothetical protein